MNVEAVQRALRTIGWRIAVDGQAGPETGRAVRAFQLGYALGPAILNERSLQFERFSVGNCAEPSDFENPHRQGSRRPSGRSVRLRL